jgi:hypothetical protein
MQAIGMLTEYVLQARDNRLSLFACRGNDAQALVDLLHVVRPHRKFFCTILIHVKINLKVLYFCQSKLELRDVLFRALVKLSKESGTYPECLVLRGVDLQSKEPQESGAFGDVWKEELQGQNVAIKVVRKYVKSDIEKIAKVCFPSPSLRVTGML